MSLHTQSLLTYTKECWVHRTYILSSFIRHDEISLFFTSATALPASTQCIFFCHSYTDRVLFLYPCWQTIILILSFQPALRTSDKWPTWVFFFFLGIFLLPPWWSRIIQTRVSEGFMKFRCFYHTLTEHYLLSISPSIKSKAINTSLTVSPHTDKSCRFLVLYFFVWWYIGVTAWTGSLQGAVSDDKTTAVFFEIFWPSFLFCGMSFFLTLTGSCL